jgi:S-adenosylmethionine:tRNA ribosyltransferase-isomerase
MKTELFDFFLPPHLIAQVPAANRPSSRLLVYDRAARSVGHRHFADIVDYFEPGDLLILNSSKVIPARLFTVPDQENSGGCEILFVKSATAEEFTAMVRPGKKFKPGRRHTLPGGEIVEVAGVLESGLRVLRCRRGVDAGSIFREHGEMPLPPYITSRESSPDRYQTVYSSAEGSIASPTAGLHFDESVFAALRNKQVKIAQVILHVGLGTFKPIEVDDIGDHQMHEEIFYISEETAELFYQTRAAGKKVWACGTTSVRTLESAIDESKRLKTGWQSTACFIRPGYEFRRLIILSPIFICRNQR